MTPQHEALVSELRALVEVWRATAQRYQEYAVGMGLIEAMSGHFSERADTLEAILDRYEEK